MTAPSVTNRVRFTQALGSRSFALLWSGQTISSLGNGAFTPALAWQVLLLTHSGVDMGLVLVAQSVPQLLFLLVGGLSADRLPRRWILFWSDAGRAVVVLAIAALSWTNALAVWHLVALGAVFGSVAAFFGPAYRAMPPQLVEREALSSANGLTEFSRQLGSLVGPALGASLVAFLGPASAFAFDGLTFVAGALTLFAVHPLGGASTGALSGPVSETVNQTATQRGGIGGMVRDVREGFAVVLGSTWLVMTIIVPAFINPAFSGALAVALPKLISDVFHQGVWLLGAVGTALGLGTLLASLLVGQLRLHHRGVIAFCGSIVASLALLTFGLPLPAPLAPYQPVVVLGAAACIGVGNGTLQTIWVTLLHELVPNDKLGRVASVDLLGSLGLLPLGFAVAGAVTDQFGPAWVFLGGGALSLVLHVIPLFFRDIRTID